SLDRDADRTFSDHLVDGAVVIAQFAQYLARMLPDTGRRPADRSPIDLEAGARLGLPHPSNHRLVELRDDIACYDLLVMDDLATTQDWCARHVGGIEPLQPFGRRVLRDVFRHLVDAGGGIDRAGRGRREPRILGKLRIARCPAEALP